jgi:hypothetical protein
MNLKNLIRTMGIAAFILLAGCSRLKPAVTPMPQAQTATAATMAPAIQVVLADGSSVTLAYSTVSHLPLQTLTISGKTEQGPTVPDLLAAAGVTQFTQVTIFGLYDKSLTFTPDQLNDNIILALREHAEAVNLESPNIPVDQWVLHVSKVQVQ